MVLIPYTKPHATAAERLAHLASRGLVVADPDSAAHDIDLIGYERLRIYFLSRRQIGVAGRPFVPGISNQHILRLYECDMRLRDVCFAAVGQFELVLRNAISEALSDAYGSHPYDEIGAFRDAAARIEALQTFVGVYARSKDQRAKHYRQTYSAPVLPPIWTMKKFLTFGAAARLFQCLNGSIKTKIATQFGVRSDQIFTSWLECLVDLRNMCAHHDRLFNRSFQKQPATLRKARLPIASSNKLKAVLECLDYLLTQRGVPSQVTAEVDAIIVTYPEVRPIEAGY